MPESNERPNDGLQRLIDRLVGDDPERLAAIQDEVARLRAEHDNRPAPADPISFPDLPPSELLRGCSPADLEISPYGQP